jgi:hypothetical protein
MDTAERIRLTKAELMLKSHAAQRDMPKVGDEDHPTPWDLDHRRIDELLDRFERQGTADTEPVNA